MDNINIIITKAEDKHIPELAKLWSENFGDSTEYINFFMENRFPSCRGIVALLNDKVVGSQYLMPVITMEYGSLKKGYYLYALSVHSNCRNQGIGKKLVEYACNLAEKENAFIILCPASKKLVDYYKKLGFIENTYVCMETKHPLDTHCADIHELTVSDFESMRNTSFENPILWDKYALEYVLEENKFVGGINIRIDYRGSYYVIGRIDSGRLIVLESNIPDKTRDEVTSILCTHFEIEEIIWTVPFNSGKTEPILYGMTYNLQKNNYYFNLILN